MDEKIFFEADSFSAIKEVLLKASSHLGIGRNLERTVIKRFSPDRIQLTGLNCDVLAEFYARTSGNRTVWIQRR